MNLKLLQELADEKKSLKTSSMVPDSPAQAEGISFLRQAIGQGFSDTDLIRQAISSFSKDIAQSSRNPTPYLGMGYIFYLFDKLPSAIACLEQALLLPPYSIEAKALLDKVKALAAGRISLSQTETVLINRLMQQQADDDMLELVEKAIIARSRVLMSLKLDPAPELMLEQDTDSKRTYLRLNELCSKLQHYLNYLDREFDVSNLELHLQQFHKILKRYEQKIAASRELRELKWDLQDHRQRAQTLNKELHQGLHRYQDAPEREQFLSDYDRQLNWLIDQCDFSADRLDANEKYGEVLQPILVDYRQLVAIIEEIQITLEDV